MKYSEAWPELIKRVRRVRKEATDLENAPKADYRKKTKGATRRELADDILDIIDELEWEFE